MSQNFGGEGARVKRMNIITLMQAALWIWFLGCVTTWKFGKVYLVEGMGIKSVEFAMLCMFSAGLLLFHIFPIIGKWVLLAILLLWIVVQFFLPLVLYNFWSKY